VKLMNAMGRALGAAVVLGALQVAPVLAQATRAPAFQVPELLGRVDSVSVSPGVIVIDGRRFSVASRIMLSRNGVDAVVSFAQVAGELPGKRVAYGLTTDGAGNPTVNRILLREAAAGGAPAAGSGARE
jgi:hypothetical protein